MKTLNQLNHLLNLNYDETLHQDLIDRAYSSMRQLADDIEAMWEVYKDKGYYIDEESFNLLNDVLGALDELSNKLKTEEEVYEEYYAEEETERFPEYIPEPDNTTVEILMRFDNALEMNDNIEMIECIEQMKEVDPVYVELMMKSMFGEDEE